MRILITNIVVLNGGDGGILFGMIKSLRQAFGEDTKFIVFASEPAAARRMYPEVTFRETIGLAATKSPNVRYWGRICRAVRSSVYLACAWCHAHGLRVVTRLFLGRERSADFDTYASADLVISSGGTYLKEDYGMSSQICDYRITLQLGRPLAFYTQSLGPFREAHYRSQLQPIFAAAQAVMLRDERSRLNLLDIGVKPDALMVMPDAVFALADPAVLKNAVSRRLPKDRPLRIVVSVRHWPHFPNLEVSEGMERYVDYMANLTHWLVVSLNAEVTLLSTCQGNPEYDDDSVTAERVLSRMEPSVAPHVKLVRKFVRFDRLLEQLPHYDLVLATRMHMAILSLSAGTPAIPLALEFKTTELYANLGLTEWVVPVEGFDATMAERKIADFIANIDGLRENLFGKVEAFRAAALAGGEEFKSFIKVEASERANG